MERLQAHIIETLERIEALASTWRSDSELSRFNANQVRRMDRNLFRTL